MAHEPPDQSDFDAAAAVTARFAERISQLNLAAEFEASGMPYSELDENGRIVTHYPAAKSAQHPSASATCRASDR